MISLGAVANKPISLKPITLNLNLATLKKEIRPYQSPAFMVRAKLQKAYEAIDEAFWQGADVVECLKKRAELVDQVLTLGWAWYELNAHPVDLIAVGGYGRELLHPHSDVDILVLTEPNVEKALTHQIEHFIAYTWDCGMNVGHSVRNVEQCQQLASDDFTILSNLLDARLICGQSKAFNALSLYINKTSKETITLKSFFTWKMRERQIRYQRFGHTEYTLEPNIKESPGGLRDVQLLGLFTKREFGTHDFNVLENIGFITTEEKQTLFVSHYLLAQLRYALHLTADKREERLFLDYQEKLARTFGFIEPQINDAISNFMMAYFRAVTDLREITSVLFQHFRELYHQDSSQMVPLNAFAKLQDESICITDESHLEQHPHEILILFAAIAKQPNIRGFVAKSTRFIRNFYQSHPLVPNESTRPLFLALFQYPRGCAKALRLMARFGLLAQYIPPFAHIIGQMQYDLYHVYTVDAHTLNMLENIQNFYNQQQPNDLIEQCLQQDVNAMNLYLGALFHDIAKGLGGNHSQLGSKLAHDFCQSHHLDEGNTRMITWLVKEHLTLSSTARTQDLTAPEVIADFCDKVKSIEALNHLYVMTIADIIATNPTLWNKWQDSLLKNLYLAAKHFLCAQTPESKLSIQTHKQAALEQLLQKGFAETDILQLWEALGTDYFQIESVDTIVWHTCELAKHKSHDYPIVSLQSLPSMGGTEIFIFAPDRVHLFALCAATLDKLQLTVVQARIITSKNGYCLNTFVVLESSGQPISGPHRNLEIEHTLKALLNPLMRDETVIPKIPFVSHRIRRHLRFFKHQAKVSITNAEQPKQTVVIVQAPDFPGLLARIGEAFMACDIFVHSAKINTLGKRVEDIFYVSDRKTNQPIQSAEIMLHLKSVILDKLSAYWNKS